MAVQPGSTLGPYRVTAPIGAGGMGEVYRARDMRIGRDVAIKVLPATISANPEFLVRFEQEARAAGMLNHPNLLSIYDVGRAEGSPYIVCELLEGETLRERLLKGEIQPRRAIDWALQIAHGLAAAHEKGIIHRDLKPENVFVTREGRVKILDFGLAKLNPAFAREGATFKQAATEPGMVMGTVGYMSPEQVRGEAVDHRSDIFSFGAILYEMFAGGRAFSRDSSIETMSAILKEEPPDLAELNPAVPEALNRIVRRCLEKEKEQRFQSARDLAFHIECLPPVGGGAARSQNGAASAGPRGGPAALQRQEPGTSPLPSRSTALPAAPRAFPSQRPQQRPARKKIGAAAMTLAAILALLLLVAGFEAGEYLARVRGSAREYAFQRITFQRGEVLAARFARDGDTIIYTAAWDGKPRELFMTRRQRPEARPLGVADAEVVSISRTDELAVLLRRDRASGLGTLARLPMVGGVPREIQNDILDADWLPDGRDLAVIRRDGEGLRIESPIGKLRYDTRHFIKDLRVSPDGARIAFIEQQAGANDISVIEEGKVRSIARGWRRGASGLAWAEGGKVLWFTGTDSAAPPALYAVKLDGDVRLLARLTGSMKLQDVSRDGRALVTHNNWRAALMFGSMPEPVPQTIVTPESAAPAALSTAPQQPPPVTPPAPAADRDLSWLDWSIAADLSPDGRMLLFSETREGGGDRSSVYLRPTDGSPPVRLGDGYADALSPDGSWVLSHASPSKLVLLPTGPGEPREVKTDATFAQGAVFLPDGRSVVIGGADRTGIYALYLLNLQSGALRRISPEGIWGDPFRPFVLSPDATTVAGVNAGKQITLYPLAEGRRAIPLPEALPREIPILWSPDGFLYVYDPQKLPATVSRINLAARTREPWKEFAPPDAAGVYKIAPIFLSRDARFYAYDSLRTLSDLYVMEPAATAGK